MNIIDILNIKVDEIIIRGEYISFDIYVWNYPLMVFIWGVVCFEFIYKICKFYNVFIFSWGIVFKLRKYIDVPVRNRLRKMNEKYEKRKFGNNWGELFTASVNS